MNINRHDLRQHAFYAPHLSPKPMNHLSKNGQAAVEYVLLVAVCVMIFGAMFGAIRQSLFKVWVCEIGPRIQSVGGCSGDSVDGCKASLQKTTGTAAAGPCP